MALFRRRHMLLIDTQGGYQSTVLGIAPASLAAYWPLTETGGTTATDAGPNGFNGTYNGVTLAQIPGAGASMGSAGLWDGVNDLCNVVSAPLGTAFNGQEGTIAFWAKSPTWDASLHHLVDFRKDNNNYVIVRQVSPAGTIETLYNANATLDQFVYAAGSPTGWIAWIVTWSLSANRLELFRDNVSVGSAGTLGTWTNTTLTVANLGAGPAAAQPFSGYLAHMAVWTVVLNAAQRTIFSIAR